MMCSIDFIVLSDSAIEWLLNIRVSNINLTYNLVKNINLGSIQTTLCLFLVMGVKLLLISIK